MHGYPLGKVPALRSDTRFFAFWLLPVSLLHRASCLLLSLLAVPALSAPLPPLGPIDAGTLALWVAPLDGGPPVYTHRADAAVNPASTMKLVTSFAALDTLGPDFHWQTGLYSSAPVNGTSLAGDLYWRGNGDPAFDFDALADLTGQLRDRGIRRIDGALLLDKSAFTSLGSSSEQDPDEGRTYQVGPDPLLTQYKTAAVRLYAGDSGWQVVLDPPLRGIDTRNRLTLTPGACTGGVGRHVSASAQERNLVLNGKVPAGCDGSVLYVPLLDHDTFQAAAFDAVWQERSGQTGLPVRRGNAPADARLLASHESPPLSEVLVGLNHYSNNVMARQVFLTLGARDGNGGDTVRNAEAAVRAALTRHGIDSRAFVFENGAGLSRRERVTAGALGELLRAAQRAPFWGEFAALLPRPGGAGTLHQRLPALAGRARFKTGTLNDVHALAGYLDAGGRRYALVAIVNASGIRNSALDSLVERIAAALDAQQVQDRPVAGR